MQRTILIFIIITLLSFTNNAPHFSKLKEVAIQAKDYCQQNNFNTDFCFFIDMSIHSGKSRFFIYDLEKDSLIKKSLVSHGCGELAWAEDYSKDSPVFSNEHESHLSSLGKYKVGKRGYSNWGINVNYKLHGLENSNSNAYNRVIVLHSWEMVSETETYPTGTPEGWGCPAVANSFMETLDQYLQDSKKPVLLWIYK